MRRPEERDSHERASIGHRRPKQAGSCAARQEQAPAALRAAGLIGAVPIGELNPARAAGDTKVLLRFVDVLPATLAAKGGWQTLA